MLVKVMRRYKQEKEIKVLLSFFAMIVLSGGSISVFQQHSDAESDRIYLKKNSAVIKMVAMA